MKNWRKYGLLISVQKEMTWWSTHAMVPTPEQINGPIWKIYFGARNKNNQSIISYAVIDLNNPISVVEYSSLPVLETGKLGTFDDNGVLPSCVLREQDYTLMYTIGFKPGGTTRMDLFGGLAISYDGINFNRWSEAPILERNRINPYINTAPWVVKNDKIYIMYYVGGVGWINKDLPRYNIQMATSEDGFYWSRQGHIAIDFEFGENALARPYVIYDGAVFHMWFFCKGRDTKFIMPFLKMVSTGNGVKISNLMED